MFALINAFLQDKGVNVLFKSEFDYIVSLAVDGHKTTAIKSLREKTMKTAYKTWVLDAREDYPAAIKARIDDAGQEPWESVIGSDDAERYVRNWFRDLEATLSL